MTTATAKRGRRTKAASEDAKRARADARRAASKDRKQPKAKEEPAKEKPAVEVTETPTKTTKEAYPGLKDGRLKAAPEDFDSKLHKPLRRANFENEADFWAWRASECEKTLAHYREQERLCRELGSTKERKKAQRVAKLRDQMSKLAAELSEQGINIDAILAAAGSDD